MPDVPPEVEQEFLDDLEAEAVAWAEIAERELSGEEESEPKKRDGPRPVIDFRGPSGG